MINENNIEKESYTSKKINKLMKINKLTSENLILIIDDNSSKELKNLCNITLDRINQILKGSCPSLLECLLIAEALGKGLSYFYYNGYQVN